MAAWIAILVPALVSVVGFAMMIGAIRANTESTQKAISHLQQTTSKLWAAHDQVKTTVTGNAARLDSAEKDVEGLQKEVRQHDRSISGLTAWRQTQQRQGFSNGD